MRLPNSSPIIVIQQSVKRFLASLRCSIPDSSCLYFNWRKMGRQEEKERKYMVVESAIELQPTYGDPQGLF